MSDYTQLRTLTRDDLIHPVPETISMVILVLFFAMSSILYPVVVYTIMNKSDQRIHKYKYVLLSQVTSSYLFVVFYALFLPRSFLPLLIGCPGFLDFGPVTLYIFLPLLLFCLAWMLHGLILSSAYGVLSALESCALKPLLNDNIMVITFTISIFIALEILLVGPLLMENPDLGELQRRLVAEVPVMKELLLEYPSISGYHPALSKGWIGFLIKESCVMLIFFILCFIYLHGVYIKRIREMNLHSENRSLQKVYRMLYR